MKARPTAPPAPPALALLALPALLALGACSVTIDGEQQERDRATAAGAAYEKPFAERELPPLTVASDLDQWLAHAEAQNGELEARWHDWLAAIEQVPQAATQDSTAMLGIEHRLDGGRSLDRSALLLASDAMNNLLLPGRLRDRGRAALAAARTAAAAFVQARLRLQRELAERWFDLALLQQEQRLQQRLRAVLGIAVPSLRARVAAGQGSPQELIRADLALLQADVELQRLAGDLPTAAASLCSAAGVDPRGRLTPVAELPPVAALALDEVQTVEQALRRDPELDLRRRAHEQAMAEVTVAEWARVPEFALGSSLMGDGAALLSAGLTLPFLRSGAIDAGIRMAAARARAADALERQAATSTTAAVLSQLAQLAALAEQDRILGAEVLPRLQSIAEIARAAWIAGSAGLADWTDIVAMQVGVERQRAQLRRDAAQLRVRLAEALGGR